MLAFPLAGCGELNSVNSLPVSVAEDCATGKRILPGLQGYIALKRKTAKHLQSGEYFLKFLSAFTERKDRKNRHYLGPRACAALQLFATNKV
jgi:hypothetical protein